jgi:GNAT superfamily N-acetyltransferase
MTSVEIVPYTAEDSNAAIQLEESLTQGGPLSLAFRRQTFHARSSVYENSILFCAKEGDRVVGVAAGARKRVWLRGEQISTLYGYDLRVHPDYRRFGTARRLAQAVMDRLGPADCNYSLVAGQNERALRFTRRAFGPSSIIQLTYLIIPVFRKRRPREQPVQTDIQTAHHAFLNNTPDVQMRPELIPGLHYGHVSSLLLEGGKGGCSIWTNQSLLAETVAHLPFPLHILRGLTAPLAQLHLAPRIPACGETVRSWFLYDLFARGRHDLRSILTGINNLALSQGRDFLYLLLQDGDPLITRIRNEGFRFLTVPYVFFAKGKKVPTCTERLYIDIRDL